jgi:hypothetical protein
MADALVFLSVILAILALLFTVYLFIDIDKRVKKRVKEELAPYREILDAMEQKTTRNPDEIAYSMMRYNSPDDPGPITVINEKTK